PAVWIEAPCSGNRVVPLASGYIDLFSLRHDARQRILARQEAQRTKCFLMALALHRGVPDDPEEPVGLAADRDAEGALRTDAAKDQREYRNGKDEPDVASAARQELQQDHHRGHHAEKA